MDMNAALTALLNSNAPSKYPISTVVVLDAGHGGLDKDGKYTTDPKNGKYFDHRDKSLSFHGIPDNSTFYEGVFNRIMANKMQYYLAMLGITSVKCYNAVEDTPLEWRVGMANALHTQFRGDTIFVSLHANAGRGTGWEIYTTVGQTASDSLASEIGSSVGVGSMVMRTDYSDGDLDREAGFYVLRNTQAPAVLIEHDFFDNLPRALLLDNAKHQNNMAALQSVGIFNYLSKRGAKVQM